MTKEKYIRGGGEKCIYCGGDISVEHMNYYGTGKIIHEVVTCIECKKCWNNIYILTDVELKEYKHDKML